MLAAVTVVTLLAGGFAFAKTFTCKATGLCRGTQHADKITGTTKVNSILGLAGRDQISAGNAADTVDGGRHNDTLNGGSGNDTYRFTSEGGPPGADRISADPSGRDTVDFSRLGERISVSIAGPTGMCPQDQRICVSFGGNFIENLTGTAFNDVLIGTSQGNSIVGRDGDDGINGAASNDVLNGEAGNDNILGGSGIDRLLGGAGRDGLTGEVGDDELDGGTQDDTYFIAGNWGVDEVIDSGDTFDTVAAYVGSGVSSMDIRFTPGPGPEVRAGANRVNWTDGIEIVQAGEAEDTFHQNTDNNYMYDVGSSDTFTGYGPGFGDDQIFDIAGTSDTLDLTAFDLADAQWCFAGDGAGNVAGLLIGFPSCNYLNGDTVFLREYFRDGGNGTCSSMPDRGVIENLLFANDENVSPERAKVLIGCGLGGAGARTAGSVSVENIGAKPHAPVPRATSTEPEEPPISPALNVSLR